MKVVKISGIGSAIADSINERSKIQALLFNAGQLIESSERLKKMFKDNAAAMFKDRVDRILSQERGEALQMLNDAEPLCIKYGRSIELLNKLKSKVQCNLKIQ